MPLSRVPIHKSPFKSNVIEVIALVVNPFFSCVKNNRRKLLTESLILDNYKVLSNLSLTVVSGLQDSVLFTIYC